MSNPAKITKNTSDWCILHRLWLCFLSLCSVVSLGWWWRWSRCLQRTGWRGRGTWGCGGGGLSTWPGWWVGFQAQWSGTWRWKAQMWGAAVLVPLKIPEEEILKFLYHSVGSCGRCDCKEGENNMTNFHTDRHYSHCWNNTIHIWSSRNQYFMYGSYPLQRIPHAFSNKQTCPIFNFSPMMSCIHSFNEKFLHLKIELQQCSPYSLCRDCDMLKNKSS